MILLQLSESSYHIKFFLDVNMKRILFLLFIATIVSIPISGSANFADTYGLSSAGMARGNALGATVSDWSSTYYNVSGLGRITATHSENRDSDTASQMQLDLRNNKKSSNNGRNDNETPRYGDELAITYFHTIPNVTINAPISVKGDDDLGFGMITIGLVIDLNHIYTMPSFISTARLGIILSVSNDFNILEVNDLDPMRHSFMRYGKKADRSVILAGIGFGFFDDLFGIGIGINVLFGGSGYMAMRNVSAVTPDPQLPEQDIQLSLGARGSPTGGLYLNLGKITSILKGLNLAWPIEEKLI